MKMKTRETFHVVYPIMHIAHIFIVNVMSSGITTYGILMKRISSRIKLFYLLIDPACRLFTCGVPRECVFSSPPPFLFDLQLKKPFSAIPYLRVVLYQNQTFQFLLVRRSKHGWKQWKSTFYISSSMLFRPLQFFLTYSESGISNLTLKS